jgi:trimeric autotransporter adhesin
MPRPSCRSAVLLAAVLLLSGVGFLRPGAAAAQVARQGSGPLDRLTLVDPRLRPGTASAPFAEVQSLLPAEVSSGWARFLTEAGGEWQGYADQRTNRLEAAEGSGIPWIPGHGNNLTAADLQAPLKDGKADLRSLEAIARAFLPRIATVLGVDPAGLVLSSGRSGHPSDSLWLVDFDVQREGRTIEGARVVFRVNNGNLVQFGTEGLPPLKAPAPRQQVDRNTALATLAAYVGGFGAADTFLDGGSLHLLPAVLSSSGYSEGFEPGNGRGLALVWQLTFRRRGASGTWRARVDAETGKVTDFRDVNEYAKVNGGVYTDSFATGSEVVLPMPFANLTVGGTVSGATSSAGLYSYSGGAVSASFSGPFVDVIDYCGVASQSAGSSGRISFGTSPGTDCATPAKGGPGNTHSSRNQFYHLNRIKQIGRGWLPANTWLDATLPAYVNIFDTCNAYWDGYSVNFFRSGFGCGNTGEIAGVSLHEYGHGLDQNDGNGSSPDLGTAESYGDITAALVTHRSCQGNGFFSSNCDAYGDACTSCSGVRDMDWAKHASGVPHTVTNFTEPHCPFGGGYDGPCGREAHCESYVISEALWDFAARDLPSPGGAAAWLTTERLWYETRSTTGSAFSCRPTNVPWTSDGCSAGSLWRTFRAADDDDGNLANGTPHSCQLFAAFDRHGLACPSDPGANVCFSACSPPPVPSLTATPGDSQVQLSWSSAGAGVVYDVYKSELGCGSGFIRTASGLSGTAYLDAAAANGLTYSYQVVARPNGNEACGAAPSACQSAVPQGPACTPPAVPAGLLAQPAGVDGIHLTWSPVSGATDVLVLRATTQGGPYTQVADLAGTATTYTDGSLAEGATYFYVLRAVADECASGNSAEASAKTQGCSPLILYSTDFETGSGLAGWTAGSFNGAPTGDWRGVQTCAAHSGSRIFRFGGAACGDDYVEDESAYVRPANPVAIPAGTSRARLSFWHRWDFEYGYDGGRLVLAVDGGAFQLVPSTALSGAVYTNGYEFTGPQTDFVNTVVDLDAACNVILSGSGGCAGHSIVFGFNASSDFIVDGMGWYLDDVTVTVCAGHGCTGAPVIAAATAPGPNSVQVSWSNGTPASSSFRVYRADGSCAASGAFAPVDSALSGSPFLDTTVSGGSTYAYRVAGLDAAGLCESDLSACVATAATGICALSPTFAGLTTAADATQATCSLDLTWPAAVSRCANPVTYNVYRSTDPNFTPGPESLIATGLTGTSFRDAGSLLDSVHYSYIVRAANAASGQEDGNLVRRNAAPAGPFASSLTLADTFEGTASGGGFDLGGWSHAAGSGGADWTWNTDRSQSPSHSWYSASQSFRADRSLVSPSFIPQAGSLLTFWHTYEFDQCYDGGTLEISVDGGSTWTVVPDAAFLEGGFTQTLFQGSPIGGKRGWCLGQLGPMTRVRLDLSGWAGQQARLRWHAGEDSVVALAGWFIDSVTLANVGAASTCTPASPQALDFYTLPPCRLVDTRGAAGPQGGPALQSGTSRLFQAAGVCGVPATAKAVAVNLTVTQPAGGGYLILAPAGAPAPLASSVNFLTGQTRSNNAVLPLGDGTGALLVKTAAGGTVQLVLDVSGYFQ